MEQLLLRSECSIFHDILKNLTFHRSSKVLLWSKGLFLSLLAATFCCLLITFANSFDPDLTQHTECGPDQDPNDLKL